MSAMTIQMPESLHQKLIEFALKDDSTPEQLAVLAIAEKLSSLLTVDYLEARAKGGKPGALNRLLEKVPDVEPEEHDKL